MTATAKTLARSGPPLFRVTGEVEAPDGTGYAPEFWGNWHQAAIVYQAIMDGATERDETARVRIDRGPGTKRIALAYRECSDQLAPEVMTR